MTLFNDFLMKRAMKLIGVLALALGALAIVPTSLASSQQPKCPDELLK
jgi:cyclic lactone autoinducer peptide